MMTATMLDAALDYARRGWPVFPLHTISDGRCSCGKAGCDSPGKHPKLTDWTNQATTDPATIRRWWTRWSGANIGIATGKASGLLVVDEDPRHGGDAALRDLEAQHGPLPATVESLTGGGGRHILFRYPGYPVKTGARVLGPGLDIKADGGCIVAAPSLHASGRRYEWEVSSHPDEVPIAETPAWLLDKLWPEATNGNERGFMVGEKIKDGERNDRLYRMARSLKAKGYSEPAILAALRVENDAKGDPPMGSKPDDETVEDIVSRALRQSDRPEFAENGEERKRSRALTFTSLGDLLGEPEEAVSYVVDGVLPSAGMGLLSGKPKAGKSTLARCLAKTVSRGEEWLGFKTTQGTVFYLALEEKRAEVRKHFAAMGATADDPVKVFIAPSPTDGLQQLRAAAEQERPGLIIIDPIVKFTRVKDLNDYAQVTVALEPLLTLARETGAHVLAVHHLGKGERSGGDAILGSTALFAAVDTALLLKRTERYRTLSSIQRYGQDLEEITLTLDPVSKIISAGPSRKEADQAETEAAILEFLQGRTEPVEREMIETAVEGRTSIKRQALKLLVEQQKITRSGKGTKGDPYKFLILVPTYIREQENKNPKNGVTSDEYGEDSCSGRNTGSDDAATSWKQETEASKADVWEAL